MSKRSARRARGRQKAAKKARPRPAVPANRLDLADAGYLEAEPLGDYELLAEEEEGGPPVYMDLRPDPKPVSGRPRPILFVVVVGLLSVAALGAGMLVALLWEMIS